MASAVALAGVGTAIWTRYKPYYFMVNGLHSGMSAQGVQASLGEPCGSTSGGGMVYRKRWAGATLLVIFDVGGPFGTHVEGKPNWFILDGAPQNGYTRYVVRDYRFFSPPPIASEEGVLEFQWTIKGVAASPLEMAVMAAPERARLVGLSTLIPGVDLNGNPLPCFSQ